ncbi:putative FAD-dependent glycerol-3-phosphate dehydrogenase [Babesia bovis T2Bo]|uniref:glycerol-3-phosphate dehydrogenase n=2 Tax=Babesia bovis TaxID=5865 RepID=A7AM76_BABBO|nr:putative FAD-dependent glycerol-3-phosphate dehydrogenase [Babesia bovis T2Bo]EDO07660.1 putative FAD-dependent glycerol-3-phosphate dehydrogenase [Babesia bovis T2Bo]|eukprot:XP_001611228.1 FAD-dependent glycerol-3-phosphate dehydrogenase [Babesia bovis T2Bo]
MGRHLGIKLFGGALVGLTGTYVVVRREHERCAIPKGTKYTVPGQLKSRSLMSRALRDEEFDVLVVGGGCTGSAVALDCATRGLKCALVEANDFASGTSSKSTKLLHGGIRYLESALLHFDIKELRFVWKALEERAHLIFAAPFANPPIPIVLPIYQLWQIPYFWFNIKVYELLARFFCCNETGVPSSYYTGKANALDCFPPLREKGLRGAVVYYDGQHDDSRTNLLMALTSTIDNYVPGQVGATVVNHTEVVELLKDSEGKVCGAKVVDKLTGDTFDVRAKAVVNCSGPFAEKVRQIGNPDGSENMLHSRGTHIVLPATYSPTQFGMVIPKTTDGRVLFTLPWRGQTLVGTTDNKDDLQWNPLPKKSDVDFICKDAAIYMNCSEESLRRDIKSVWSGLRPLLKGLDGQPDSEKTDSLSRGHVIHVDRQNLVNVYGGKWTICRLMAEECVDRLLEANPDVKAKTRCRTRNLRLYGTHNLKGEYNPDEIRPMFNTLSVELRSEFPGLTPEQAAHLVESYGYHSREVARMSAEAKMLKPIHPDFPYLQGEVLYGVRREFACTPLDILARRTRIAFLDNKAAAASLDTVCDIMGRELSWSSSRRAELRSQAVDFFNTMNVPVC